jgi:hypothetical protein
VGRGFAFARLGVLALMVGTPAATRAIEPSPPPAARSHLIPGELTRVDLARRSVVVKADGPEAREVEAWTGAETRVTARGRVIRLEDLRPGDRVLVTCTDAAGRHQAGAIKVVARIALPTPSPGAAPSPAGASPSGPTQVPSFE